jgi:hypothetical protein
MTCTQSRSQSALLVALTIALALPAPVIAQGGLSAVDSGAVMTAAVKAAVGRLSGKRRFLESSDSNRHLSPALAKRLAATANATLASRDAYQVCNPAGRCRVAPDAEVLTVEAPVVISRDSVSIRVLAHQGTSIKRMPVATSTFAYRLAKRDGQWCVVDTRITRQ